MEPTYELISDNEIKITEQPAPVETVVQLDSLTEEKATLLREIDDFNTRAAFEVGNRTSRIAEIDALLAKVTELKAQVAP